MMANKNLLAPKPHGATLVRQTSAKTDQLLETLETLGQRFHRNELRLVRSTVRFVPRRTKRTTSRDRTTTERRAGDRSNHSPEAIELRIVRLV